MEKDPESLQALNHEQDFVSMLLGIGFVLLIPLGVWSLNDFPYCAIAFRSLCVIEIVLLLVCGYLEGLKYYWNGFRSFIDYMVVRWMYTPGPGRIIVLLLYVTPVVVYLNM